MTKIEEQDGRKVLLTDTIQSEIGTTSQSQLQLSLNIIKSSRKFIILMTTISTLLAILIALYSTPIYRSEVLLAPTNSKNSNKFGLFASQLSGISSLAGLNLSGGNNKTTEAIAVLKSRGFTSEFIGDLNLLPILFSKKWDYRNKKWLDNIEIPTLWDAYRLFNKKVRKIKRDTKTGFIILAIEWKDPKLAAEWVMRLVNRINKKLAQEAIDKADKTIKYLESELDKTSIIEVKTAIFKLIEVQTKNKMLANTQKEYVFHVLDPAVIPEDRIKPKRILIVMVGFFLGLSLSVFFIFLRRSLQY